MADEKRIKGKISYGEWAPAAGGTGKVRDVFCRSEFVGVQADTGSVTLFLTDEPDREMWMSDEVVFAFKSGQEFEKFIQKCVWTTNFSLYEDGVESWELTDCPGGNRVQSFFKSVETD